MTDSQSSSVEEFAPAASISRRTNPRFECRHITFYRLVNRRSREAELATINDISVAGIGLLIREQIDPGTILSIELQSTVRQVRHQFLARVTHALGQGDGYILIGCEFATRLTESELEAFLH